MDDKPEKDLQMDGTTKPRQIDESTHVRLQIKQNAHTYIKGNEFSNNMMMTKPILWYLINNGSAMSNMTT